jgi:glyoxylase I family protein
MNVNTPSVVSGIQGMAPYLEVYDMPAALHFYRDILGFTVVMQSQPERGDDCGFALLRLNGMELMLNTQYDDGERPPERDGNRDAAHADTALYFGCPDIDGLYAHLVSKNIQAGPPQLTGYGFKAIYLKDPDGYGLVFQWPAER